MACSNPSGTTTGILIAYDPTDTGNRPFGTNIAYWATPNIRMALATDVPALMSPAAWDNPPYANWNGQVEVGSTYQMMVRVRNTDPSSPRDNLQLQGWVADYTMGGVGPTSALGQNGPNPGPGNPELSFTGFNAGPLAAANPANPNDPASMLVLHSEESWTVTSGVAAVNGGHVCTGANVYTMGDGSTPADGQQFFGVNPDLFLDPSCDRMYGQRNVQIVQVAQGQHVQIPAVLFLPTMARRPLQAAVAIRPVALKEGQGGVLQDVPELSRAARDLAITQLQRPEGDPLRDVWWGPDRLPNGDPDPGLLKVTVEPGRRMELKVNLGAQNHRPGDAYALDLVTTDTATGRLFGGARVYVLVTA